MQVDRIDLRIGLVPLEVVDVPGAEGQVHERAGPVLTEDPPIDVAHQWFRTRLGARVIGALDGGDAAHQCAHFAVAKLCALGDTAARFQRRELLLWLLDQDVVLVAATPGCPVLVQLGRLPRREHVVVGMVVHIDEPGHDDTVCFAWFARAGVFGGDGHDLAAVDEHIRAGHRAVRCDGGAMEHKRPLGYRPIRRITGYAAENAGRIGLGLVANSAVEPFEEFVVCHKSHPRASPVVARMVPYGHEPAPEAARSRSSAA